MIAMKSIVILVLLLFLFAACSTKEQHTAFSEETLLELKISVDEDDLFDLASKSLFFVKLNDIVKKQHPNIDLHIFVDSHLLPSLLDDVKTNDVVVFVDRKRTVSQDGPVMYKERLMTMLEVLNLYCDITITRFEFRDHVIFIIPDKRDLRQSLHDSF